MTPERRQRSAGNPTAALRPLRTLDSALEAPRRTGHLHLMNGSQGLLSGEKCLICGRTLSVAEDPLSLDCGGDCWGCIGQIEADMGHEPSVELVRNEIKLGLRLSNGRPKDR